MPTAERWREHAANAARKAHALMNSGTSRQRITPRRLRIVSSQIEDAKKLEQLRQAAEAMARCVEANSIPRPLNKIVTLTALDQVVWWMRNDTSTPTDQAAERAGLAGAREMEQARRLLAQLISAPPSAHEQEAELRHRMARMALAEPEGFWPTPPSIAKIVTDAADLGPDVRHILEPSCGAGCLLLAAVEAARRAGAKHVRATAYELHHELAKLAEDRTARLDNANLIRVEQANFLQQPQSCEPDIIVMNPPFENGQEIEHTRTAWEWLAPGGRLVSIISVGPTFRSDRRSTEWQEWFAKLGGYIMQLPPDAFDRPDALRRTSVHTALIVLDKPA